MAHFSFGIAIQRKLPAYEAAQSVSNVAVQSVFQLFGYDVAAAKKDASFCDH
jgi:hypothetical protein